MLRNNADVRRCAYFELGLPVLLADILQKPLLGAPDSIKREPKIYVR